MRITKLEPGIDVEIHHAGHEGSQESWPSGKRWFAKFPLKVAVNRTELCPTELLVEWRSFVYRRVLQAAFCNGSGYNTAHEYTETVDVVMTSGHTNPSVIAKQFQQVSTQNKPIFALTVFAVAGLEQTFHFVSWSMFWPNSQFVSVTVGRCPLCP